MSRSPDLNCKSAYLFFEGGLSKGQIAEIEAWPGFNKVWERNTIEGKLGRLITCLPSWQMLGRLNEKAYRHILRQAVDHILADKGVFWVPTSLAKKFENCSSYLEISKFLSEHQTIDYTWVSEDVVFDKNYPEEP